MRRFNNHSWLEGQHARLGASQHSWLGYDEEKMLRVAASAEEARRGTKKHELAKMLIELGERLPDLKKTLNRYVNDAIGFRMTPEVILFATEFSFGTADALSFRNGLLRIHDLKTGTIPGHFEQLEIYAAQFCIEYDERPVDIDMVFRIYQHDDFIEMDGDPLRITSHMSKIKRFSEILGEYRKEVGIDE